MGRRRKTNFEESLLKNSRSYGIYFERLAELSMSMFKWENVPETVDKRFLEMTLFYDGQAVFFRDEALGYLALQVIINGRLNVYRIPIQRRAFAVNGYSMPLDITDSVIVYNNYLHTNSIMSITHFASKLWDIDRTFDVNMRAQKTPTLLQGTPAQRLTLLNLYKEYDGNAPVIFGDKSLDAQSLRVLKTDAPFLADKIFDAKMKVWNEALTYLGIVSIDTTKRERMISSEIMNNQGDTFASRNSRLKARQEACDQINRMFGLDIKVSYDDDYIRENIALMADMFTGGASYSAEEGEKEDG